MSTPSMPSGASTPLRLFQQGRDSTQLVDRRPSRDLGGMGGEHRTHRHLPQPLGDVVDLDTGLLDARAGSRREAQSADAQLRHLIEAVVIRDGTDNGADLALVRLA